MLIPSRGMHPSARFYRIWEAKHDRAQQYAARAILERRSIMVRDAGGYKLTNATPDSVAACNQAVRTFPLDYGAPI